MLTQAQSVPLYHIGIPRIETLILTAAIFVSFSRLTLVYHQHSWFWLALGQYNSFRFLAKRKKYRLQEVESYSIRVFSSQAFSLSDNKKGKLEHESSVAICRTSQSKALKAHYWPYSAVRQQQYSIITFIELRSLHAKSVSSLLLLGSLVRHGLLYWKRKLYCTLQKRNDVLYI